MPARWLLLLALIPAAARAQQLDVPALMAQLAAVPERRAVFQEEKALPP